MTLRAKTMGLSTKYFNCVHEKTRQNHGGDDTPQSAISNFAQILGLVWDRSWENSRATYFIPSKLLGVSFCKNGHSIPIYAYVISRLCLFVCLFVFAMC